MRIVPVSWDLLVEEITAKLPADRRARVAVDGAAALAPEALAGRVVGALRDAGRYALHVDVNDYLLPASQRFEFGKTSPEAFYEGWRDEGALRREVLDPAADDGSGRVLPRWWRVDVDRSARADYVAVPPGGVVVVSGPFLLGAGLPFEVTVLLTASDAAVARRTPAGEEWTLPAYARYRDEVGPEYFADLVIRAEDPRRPALVRPGPA